MRAESYRLATMEGFSVDRRTVLRGVAGAGAAMSLPTANAAAEAASETEPTTRATYSAIVEAVIPETPDVATELGEEHEPGGREIGLDAYLIEYVNTLFSAGTPAGEVGNLRLAELVAKLCDVAAVELLARAENEETPDPQRVEAGLVFAALAPDDRLRALALLDEKEFDTGQLAELTNDLGVPLPALEGTAGLVPQLVVAFTQVIYYSEWEGYDDLSAPPSEREFSPTVDGEKLQSWQQADFPGVIDGAACLRGYWGLDDSPLGDGAVWKDFDDDNALPDPAPIDEPPGEGDGRPASGEASESPAPKLYMEPGEFAEDDYDTSDYEEPFDTSGEPEPTFDADELDVRRPEEAIEEARDNIDEGLFGGPLDRLFGNGGLP